MSDSDAVELQPKRLPPSAEKGSDWEPLVESKSGLDIPGRSSVQPLEPRYVETPENETRSIKKSYRRFLSRIPRIPPLVRHLALVHLPPVAITLTVLSLYIRNHRWDNPTDNALNALLFAAKIHEALIIVSIGDMLMGRINHHLLNKGNSLPLGFLPSPLLLNSPFLYLISSELWAPIRYSKGRHGAQKVTGAMIILSALLCLAASPLSAITMIPRPGWQELPYSPVPRVEKNKYTPGTLYSTNLDSEDIPALNYTRYSQWFTRPSQKSILETTITTDTSFTELVPYTNVTYSNYEATRRPISYKKTPGYGTVATCPLSIVARNIGTLRYGAGRYLELITARNNVNGSSTLGKWKQPLVITKCSSSKIVDGVASFSFGPPFFKETAERRFQHVKIPLAKHPWLLNLNTTENLSTSADPLGYSFLNIKDEVKLPISADIMFATVMNETVDSMKGTLPLRPSAVQFTLCLVSALWTEADVWLEPQRSKDALSHLSFANGEEVARIAESFGTRDFIDIHEDWMTGIGSVPTSTNMSSYDEALRFCLAATPYGIWEPSKGCVETFLSMHITDALAELGDWQENIPLDSPGDKGLNNSVIYTNYVYAYSYKLGGSIGIPIAFSILLLHILIVLVYIPLVFWSGHLQHKSGWNSLGDLLVLTLCSDVDVDWTEGKASQNWIKRVAIRELGDEGRNGMIVRDIGNNIN
ncbi:hypothetical protein FPOA_09118 [Fusarium poae]|uniref:Uncharacterized protein n=1 Tax=Fusarium poae TaxID=36050 RepID=A0A1B8AR22_FUSPO|nr:hypothetical protein FPOA_09118 [Fusarium poae]